MKVGRLVECCLHEAQKRFTMSEVAADWIELMILQHIMLPSNIYLYFVKETAKHHH